MSMNMPTKTCCFGLGWPPPSSPAPGPCVPASLRGGIVAGAAAAHSAAAAANVLARRELDLGVGAEALGDHLAAAAVLGPAGVRLAVAGEALRGHGAGAAADLAGDEAEGVAAVGGGAGL